MQHQQPKYDGRDPKQGVNSTPGPQDPKTSRIEHALGDFADLVAAAKLSPNPDYLGVSVCAANFVNSATVALRRADLPPDLVVVFLNLRVFETGQLAFVYAKQIDPLLIEVSQAIKEQIIGSSGYFVSFDALASLARFVAEEDDIGVPARLAAYEAIIIGSTRSIQIRTESTDTGRRDSSELIDQISRALQLQASDKPQLITEIIRGIRNIPTHSFLAQSVSDLLQNLSTK